MGEDEWNAKDGNGRMVDFRQVRLAGEWADRSRLQQKDLLTWYPLLQDSRQGAPLDFRKDILILWLHRRTAAEMAKEPNTYTGLGKVLTAMVQYAAVTGDAGLIQEKEILINAILASQDEDGYFGTIRREEGQPAEALWQIWNLHDGAYMGLALTEDYRLFGRKASLNAACRYADLVIRHWKDSPKEPGILSPIGITDLCLALADLSGISRYRNFAAETPFDGRFIERTSLLDWRQELYPARGRAEDNPHIPNFQLKVHTYRYFARLIDQLVLYGHMKREELLVMSRYTRDKLTDPACAAWFVSGAVGRSEGWVEDQIGIGAVGEGCAVVHLIWWLSRMIGTDSDPVYGNIIERALFNHIRAAQDPVTGQTRYFVPLSGTRSFRKGAHCCDGNYRRFWATAGQLVYYTCEDGIVVDQFMASAAEIRMGREGDHRIILTQETDYPASGQVEIRVDPDVPEYMVLRIRIPAWAAACRVQVNGREATAESVSGGIALRRTWERGDRVTLTMPMPFRWVAGMKHYAGYAALMRGPQLFCLASSANPALREIGNWRDITVDVNSLEMLTNEAGKRDGVRRPLEVKARGWRPGKPMGESPDLALIFSDFAVMDGYETYVHINHPEAAVGDELYRPGEEGGS